MFKLVVGIAFVLIASVAVYSQEATVMTDLERIGKSDLIVIGTVDKVTDIGKQIGKLELSDISVLKGKNTDKLVILNLASFRGKKITMLDPGQRYIFFLYQVPGGYTLYHGSLSVLPVTDEKKITDLINNYPVAVVVDKPDKLYNYADPFAGIKLKVTVKNNTDTPINVSLIQLEGFFEANDFPTRDISLLRDEERSGRHNSTAAKTTIAPNDNYVTELIFPLEQPESWMMTPPKEQTKYDLNIRVCVSVDKQAARNPNDVYHVCSSSFETQIEYIPIGD